MQEDIEQLRELIRGLKLDWLDEEIEEIFTAGKLQEKEFQEGKKRKDKGIERIPFSEEEQLKIIIKSLQNYFILLPQIQSEADKELVETLKIEQTTFIETENKNIEKIKTENENLASLLNDIIK